MARLYSNLPKRKAKFRGEQPFTGHFEFRFPHKKKEKKIARVQVAQPLTVPMESYLSLMEEESRVPVGTALWWGWDVPIIHS